MLISDPANEHIKKEELGTMGCFHDQLNDVCSEPNKIPESDDKENILPLFPTFDEDYYESASDDHDNNSILRLKPSQSEINHKHGENDYIPSMNKL